MKCKNYDFLPDAQNEVIMNHEISTPNTTVIARLLKKYHKFQDRIKLKWTDEDDENDRRRHRYDDMHYLSKNYRKNVEEQKLKRRERISDVDMEAERRYLFTTQPILFNAEHATNLDRAIQGLIEMDHITVPIVHVKDQRYLVGSKVVELRQSLVEVSSNKKVKSLTKPHVIIGKGQVPLDEYIEEHHEEFEKTLIGYMHEKD